MKSFIFSNATYYVDENGNIYGKNKNKLKQRLDADGYPTVTTGNRHVKRTPRRVHRFVALYYVDNPFNKPEVNHIDGDKENNHFSNLEWCTRSENVQHAFNLNLKKGSSGEKNGRSRLTETDIPFILDLYENKEWRIADIAKKFDVGWSTIKHITKKDTWFNNGFLTYYEETATTIPRGSSFQVKFLIAKRQTPKPGDDIVYSP